MNLLPALVSSGRISTRIGPDCGFISAAPGKCSLPLKPPTPKLSLGSKSLWMGGMNVTLGLLQKCILVFSALEIAL